MNHEGFGVTVEYTLVSVVIGTFLLYFIFPQILLLLWISLVFGAMPTLVGAVRSTLRGKISIDSFNVFAIAVSFIYGEVFSATFIILMLAFARLLNTYTESKTHRTIIELLKFRPQTAMRERNGVVEEVNADTVKVGDILVIRDGARIPVDGTVIFGNALINEASVTGESVPIAKIVGDRVLSATLNESGVIKIRATQVGKDSTIEQMVALVKEASKNKGRSEKLADRFAGIYLPVVLVIALATYLITHDLSKVAAIFLVACADDMSVAIPLAITAAIGKSAQRGVVIKGGEWIEHMSKLKTIVLDKTGTLTYGSFTVEHSITEGISDDTFWKSVGIAEKFSEHPIGRALFKEALKHMGDVPDPTHFTVHKGSGVEAKDGDSIIVIGTKDILELASVSLNDVTKNTIEKELSNSEATKIAVLRNNQILGYLTVGDVPRPRARESIEQIKQLGIQDIQMFTGDNSYVASNIAKQLGINNVHASMKPAEKLEALEKDIKAGGSVAMVGDGVNDAAALARADVSIAMGLTGAAVAIEAADIVILNDDLSRIPETIAFSKKVVSVIQWDIVLWLISNVLGFILVFTGVIGPALAAFYNFISDFFPILNSARVFKSTSEQLSPKK